MTGSGASGGGIPADLPAPASASAPAASGPRAPGWRPVLLAVTTPILVTGFVASALSNRIVFALAAVALAALAVPVLRRGFEAGHGLETAFARRARIAGRAALLLALAAAAMGQGVAVHGESLDLGYRAVAWSVYTPVATTATTWWLLALGLLALAVALAMLPAAMAPASERSRSPRLRPPASPSGAPSTDRPSPSSRGTRGTP